VKYGAGAAAVIGFHTSAVSRVRRASFKACMLKACMLRQGSLEHAGAAAQRGIRCALAERHGACSSLQLAAVIRDGPARRVPAERAAQAWFGFLERAASKIDKGNYGIMGGHPAA